MAMTTCRECGREISTAAAACPRCGATRGKPAKGVQVFGILGIVAGLGLLGRAAVRSDSDGIYLAVGILGTGLVVWVAGAVASWWRR